MSGASIDSFCSSAPVKLGLHTSSMATAVTRTTTTTATVTLTARETTTTTTTLSHHDFQVGQSSFASTILSTSFQAFHKGGGGGGGPFWPTPQKTRLG